MRLIFKAEMLVYQSKATLAEKIVFGEISHHIDLGVRKMLVLSMLINFV